MLHLLTRYYLRDLSFLLSEPPVIPDTLAKPAGMSTNSEDMESCTTPAPIISSSLPPATPTRPSSPGPSTSAPPTTTPPKAPLKKKPGLQPSRGPPVPTNIRVSNLRKRKKLEQEEEKETEKLAMEKEAMEVLDWDGCEEQELEQDLEEGSSRSKEKPYGDMKPRTFRRYKDNFTTVLQAYTTLEQCDLAMYLAGAYSSPSLPCPLRPSKLAICLSPANLNLHLNSNK